jgi:hypothetical protein
LLLDLLLFVLYG